MIGPKTPKKNVPDTEFGPRNRFGLIFQKLPSEMKGKPDSKRLKGCF